MQDAKPKTRNIKLAIVDTMFSRVNMGAIAIDEITKNYPDVEIIRRTVPGFKDLAVECKLLLEKGCDIAIALGMAGGAPIDVQCAHEASMSILQAKLMANKHIVEVFVFENEAWNKKELMEIFDNRIRMHCHNAVALVTNPQMLIDNAGTGKRQGKPDEGKLKLKESIRISIVVSEFNNELTGKMLETATAEIKKHGAELGEVIKVPGAYDIPLAAKKLLLFKENDAIVALGAIVTGETKHDEVIAQSTATAITGLSLQFNKPIAFGIIGPGATWKQAEERADEYAKRAVQTSIELVKKLRR